METTGRAKIHVTPILLICGSQVFTTCYSAVQPFVFTVWLSIFNKPTHAKTRIPEVTIPSPTVSSFTLFFFNVQLGYRWSPNSSASLLLQSLLPTKSRPPLSTSKDKCRFFAGISWEHVLFPTQTVASHHWIGTER